MARRSKYALFTEFLKNSNNEEVRMTFDEINQMVGMPTVAWSDRSAWANCTTIHATPFQRSWQNAGYYVAEIDMQSGSVLFAQMGFLVKQNLQTVLQETATPPQKPQSCQELLMLTRPDNLKELENDEYFMVALSQNNSKLVEDCIQHDPAYQSKGKGIMEARFKDGDYSKEAYYSIIKRIVTENSTRTGDDDVLLFAKYCADLDNKFLERVKDGDIKLVDDICKHVEEKGGKKIKSLASKVCKYLNEWKFNGYAYTINDSVVRAILPYYFAYYNIDGSLWKNKDFDKLSYEEFYGVFSELRNKTKLNNNELDHLIWYAYKNDSIRTEIAKALSKVL
jgi:hypothetical protein